MQKEYSLEAILTVTTGINFTINGNEIFDLLFYTFSGCTINDQTFPLLLEKLKIHILTIHPFLWTVNYYPSREHNSFIWLEAQKLQYGHILPICPFGESLMHSRNCLR